jgi:hypothetical protein
LAYNIYNPSLDLYASVSADVNDARILATKRSNGTGSISTPNEDRRTLFFIIQTANCYTFVPISRNSRGSDSIHLGAVVNQEGSQDNGTAVVAGQRTGSYPGRARWVVERIHLDPTPEDPANGLYQLQLEQLLGRPLAQSVWANTRFRIVPALTEGNRLQSHMGWQAGTPGGFIVLGSGETPAAEWEIRFKKAGEKGDLFSIYNPAIKQFAAMGGGGFLVAGDEELFYLKYSMGFLSIRGQRSFLGPNHSYYALNLNPGAGIRVGGGLEDARPADKTVSLAKWTLLPVIPKPA